VAGDAAEARFAELRQTQKAGSDPGLFPFVIASDAKQSSLLATSEAGLLVRQAKLA